MPKHLPKSPKARAKQKFMRDAARANETAKRSGGAFKANSPFTGFGGMNLVPKKKTAKRA